MTDYQKGYRAGVAACYWFLAKAADEPTLADDMKKHVLPNRNWKSRLIPELAQRVASR